MLVSILIPYMIEKVASYEFTTLTCIPGVIMYKGAKVQVFFHFQKKLQVGFCCQRIFVLCL